MSDEIQHSVTLTRDFLMAKYDVTVGEFREFALATAYLTEAEKKGDGWVVIEGIEQPKPDASWQKPYFQQTDSDPVVLVTWNDAIAWCSRNSANRTHPVGQKAPNALGLYDMSGNVDQWCWDLFGGYPSAPQVDPIGGNTGIWRVHRGGSWLASPGQYVRTAYRYVYKTETRTTIGFRLVRFP